MIGQGTSTTIPARDFAQPRISRARSIPAAGKFRAAVLFAAVHYLGLVATVTAFAMIFHRPSEPAVQWFVWGVVFCAASWLAAFFKRRSAVCPLCKGTPLINSGARAHVRARRLFPLNHGTTAVVSILATQKFRCMYCGSDFDLLKPPSRTCRSGPVGEPLR